MNRTGNRNYRIGMGGDRLSSFIISFKESDIWIGIPKNKNTSRLRSFSQSQIKNLRTKLDNYIDKHPEFRDSLSPIDLLPDTPSVIKSMIKASQRAETGPMAGVAGAFSQSIGQKIIKKFNPNELVLENGGDNFLLVNSPLTCSIYAGDSPLSEKLGFEIKPDHTPIGICTSAGTYGPSKSFGKADAVVVASKNTILADCFATAIANNISSQNDIQKNIKRIKQTKDLIAGAIIKNDKIAVAGELELKLIDK